MVGHRRAVTVAARTALQPRSLALVAAGGAAGASVRWAVGTATAGEGAFPWWTLAVNVAGCLVLGLLLGVREEVRLGLGTGFCGGLTTFSTFAVEVAKLLDAGNIGTATTYLSASLVLGILALVGGRAVAAVR